MMGPKSHNPAAVAASRCAPFLCAGYRLADTPPHAPAHRPAERFRGEWFATGDEYLRDEDGFYHHGGRSDDMLKISGLWVSPSEIEDALTGIPTIAEPPQF
jgi:benzoate-CoA ligase